MQILRGPTPSLLRWGPKAPPQDDKLFGEAPSSADRRKCRFLCLLTCGTDCNGSFDMTGSDRERVAQDIQFIHSAADKMKLLLDEHLPQQFRQEIASHDVYTVAVPCLPASRLACSVPL